MYNGYLLACCSPASASGSPAVYMIAIIVYAYCIYVYGVMHIVQTYCSHNSKHLHALIVHFHEITKNTIFYCIYCDKPMACFIGVPHALYVA